MSAALLFSAVGDHFRLRRRDQFRDVARRGLEPRFIFVGVLMLAAMIGAAFARAGVVAAPRFNGRNWMPYGA
jgi:hypothetical protein